MNDLRTSGNARAMRFVHILVFLVLLLVPASAHANVGTPIMWLEIFHLLFGNLFIGIVEGWLLSRIFGAPLGRTILLFIGANYASAFLGYLLITGPVRHLIHPTLSNAWLIFWLLMAVAFLLTLLAEFPFAFWALKGKPSRLKKAIVGTLLVQSVSYAVLAWLYWGASGTSLYTETRIVDPASFRMPSQVEIVFTSASDGSIYSGSLSERKWTKIAEKPSKKRGYNLVFRKENSELRLDFEVPEGELPIPALQVFSDTKVYDAPRICEKDDFRRNRSNGRSWSRHFGITPTLGEAKASDWSFETGVWALAGLSGKNRVTGVSRHIAWETLFTQWHIRQAILLPGDVVIFQLGTDQICLYDPNNKTLCLLCQGQDPVAFIRQNDRTTECAK